MTLFDAPLITLALVDDPGTVPPLSSLAGCVASRSLTSLMVLSSEDKAGTWLIMGLMPLVSVLSDLVRSSGLC
jgi:hypothetical protein